MPPILEAASTQLAPVLTHPGVSNDRTFGLFEPSARFIQAQVHQLPHHKSALSSEWFGEEKYDLFENISGFENPALSLTETRQQVTLSANYTNIRPLQCSEQTTTKELENTASHSTGQSATFGASATAGVKTNEKSDHSVNASGTLSYEQAQSRTDAQGTGLTTTHETQTDTYLKKADVEVTLEVDTSLVGPMQIEMPTQTLTGINVGWVKFTESQGE